MVTMLDIWVPEERRMSANLDDVILNIFVLIVGRVLLLLVSSYIYSSLMNASFMLPSE